MRPIYRGISLALFLALCACGGGGGASTNPFDLASTTPEAPTPPPKPAPSAPEAKYGTVTVTGYGPSSPCIMKATLDDDAVHIMWQFSRAVCYDTVEGDHRYNHISASFRFVEASGNDVDVEYSDQFVKGGGNISDYYIHTFDVNCVGYIGYDEPVNDCRKITGASLNRATRSVTFKDAKLKLNHTAGYTPAVGEVIINGTLTY